MKHRFTIIAALVLSLSATQLAFSREVGEAVAGWGEQVRAAQAHYRLREYDQAVVAAKKSLELAEENGGPDDLAIALSLNSLAMSYQAQKKYAEAESLYQRALAILEKEKGPEHASVVKILNPLAELYRAMDREQDAEPLERRAARIDAIQR